MVIDRDLSVHLAIIYYKIYYLFYYLFLRDYKILSRESLIRIVPQACSPTAARSKRGSVCRTAPPARTPWSSSVASWRKAIGPPAFGPGPRRSPPSSSSTRGREWPRRSVWTATIRWGAVYSRVWPIGAASRRAGANRSGCSGWNGRGGHGRRTSSRCCTSCK